MGWLVVLYSCDKSGRIHRYVTLPKRSDNPVAPALRRPQVDEQNLVFIMVIRSSRTLPVSDDKINSQLRTSRKGIFICYRRDDAGAFAGWVHAHLAARFGPDRVFLDVVGIDPGEQFQQTIQTRIGGCGAALVLIGRNWLNVRNEHDQLRLQDPDDLVRFEIASALEKGLRIIPILVDGAKLPRRDQLHENIQPLLDFNGIDVQQTNFYQSLDSIIRKLQSETVFRKKLVWPIGVFAVLFAVVFAAGFWLFGLRNSPHPVPPRPDETAIRPKSELPEKTRIIPEPPRTRTVEGDQLWASISGSNEPEDFKRYLDKSPKGDHAEAARAKLQSLSAQFIDAANSLTAANQWAQAEVAYKRVTKLGMNPKTVGWHNGFGITLMNLNKLNESSAEFKKAIELDPKNPLWHFNLGLCYLYLQDWPNYETVQQTLAVLEPSNAGKWGELGLARAKQGKLQSASEAFKQYVKLDPNRTSQNHAVYDQIMSDLASNVHP